MGNNFLTGFADVLFVISVSLFVIFVLVVGYVYYINDVKKKDTGVGKAEKKVDTNIAKEKIINFLPFDSVEDNMIMMDKGDKFVMLIGANGVNYYLMSDAEKEAVEGGFIQILNSLRFPVQIYVQTTSVNLDKSLEIYRDRRRVMEDSLLARAQHLQYLIREGETSEEELDEKRIEIEKFKNVYEYTQDLILNTENITLNQWIIKKNYYIVVPYYVSESGMLNRFTEDEVKKIAHQELETRASSIIDGLFNIGVNAHIVGSDELKQVVYSALNRDDSGIFTFEKAKEAEFDSLFKTTQKAYDNMNIETSKISKSLFDFNY